MKLCIGIILTLLGVGCIITACIWQQVLCYQTFGVIFQKVFIPHWSALFYLGAIPMTVGWYMTSFN